MTIHVNMILMTTLLLENTQSKLKTY